MNNRRSSKPAEATKGQETHQFLGSECYLCKNKNPYMSQYSKWSAETKLFVAHHLGKSPPAILLKSAEKIN